MRIAVRLAAVFVLFAVVPPFAVTAVAQQPPAAPEAEEPEIRPPQQVEVRPGASDAEIAERLERILESTEWFTAPVVRVDNGVAILEGQTEQARYREWAEETAIRTTDVVAVVNRIEVVRRSVWDLTPASESLQELGRETVQTLPLVGVGLVIILLFFLIARLIGRLVGRGARRRLQSVLLGQVVGNAVAVLLFLVGLYIALRVSGLSRLAVTVLGGTGLVGLAIGFAFRDIAENYLSSILISLNRPFRIDDFIEVEGYSGFVQRVTTRGTTLMTLDGNHVQIPNSTVYKATITNYSTNRNTRQVFAVGIGFDAAITRAQQVIYRTLRDHSAVLVDPPPLVLVDHLGAATVQLQCIFWMDTRTHSLLKVKSAVIRLTKEALVEAGISMPDEAREVLFPEGVPVQMLTETAPRTPHRDDGDAGRRREGQPPEPECSEAEDGLQSEAKEIERQASHSELPDEGRNLLSRD